MGVTLGSLDRQRKAAQARARWLVIAVDAVDGVEPQTQVERRAREVVRQSLVGQLNVTRKDAERHDRAYKKKVADAS